MKSSSATFSGLQIMVSVAQTTATAVVRRRGRTRLRWLWVQAQVQWHKACTCCDAWCRWCRWWWLGHQRTRHLSYPHGYGEQEECRCSVTRCLALVLAVVVLLPVLLFAVPHLVLPTPGGGDGIGGDGIGGDGIGGDGIGGDGIGGDGIGGEGMTHIKGQYQPQEDQPQADLYHSQAFLRNTLQAGSSIFCSNTSDVNHRRCHLQNVCYRTTSDGEQQFLFFHGPDTILENVPQDRYSPALASLSSVMDHNVQFFNYIDFQARNFEFEHHHISMITEPALLFRRFKPDNIMHVLHDDLLPLFFTLRSEFGAAAENRALLVCADEFSTSLSTQRLYELLTQRDILYLQHLQQDPAQLTCFSSLRVGISKRTTWYDYGFEHPQGPLPSKDVDGRDLRVFARFLISKLEQLAPAAASSSSQVSSSSVSPPAIRPQSPIAVFSRTRNRFILNEAKLIRTLRAAFHVPVVVVRMETHTFEEQVAILSTCRAAIGMHGSMMIMGMFLPPGALLLELFPFAVPPEHYTPYRTMAQLPGLDLVYVHWVNTIEANSVAHPDRPAHLGGIAHLPPSQQEEIRETMSIPQHTCCMNPFWLYRIYQDTFVDIYDVMQLLQDHMLPPPSAGRPLDTVRLLDAHPHQPRDIACSFEMLRVEHNEPTEALVVAWTPPINADDVRVSHYEVWVQELLRVFQTSDPFIAIDAAAVLSLPAQTIWVRAVSVHGTHNGPFAPPITCSRSEA
ncbi:hypothetical protein PTSG_12894 [Salpingoeca rosetta]|uniref:Glycosyltransferase 61 catalytic domain-containing protein n=1 Tax=Salpingoeca rosetta (strain ATCC 50818 / BSB-021) TaxID=946362 RepID=F2UL58_SALR5|nr:uncharacterized protein PTSG_12894 [Salpingoeca rosetta]EGD77857.1 hypothetical protein PTSG_12894 [Salpingoeca rosetta]|eukprot:XP_004989921.1 hypothetical protein PTSG_12894 [Salpingoeca rosetta]